MDAPIHHGRAGRTAYCVRAARVLSRLRMRPELQRATELLEKAVREARADPDTDDAAIVATLMRCAEYIHHINGGTLDELLAGVRNSHATLLEDILHAP